MSIFIQSLNRRITIVIAVLMGFMLSASTSLAAKPVVCVVLFYSTTCPHCHVVIYEGLPPLIEVFGEQLLILGIDVGTQEGQRLFLAALEENNIPKSARAVPMLFVGKTFLVGSIDIPEKLPRIISDGLAAGGIDWPNIDGLNSILETRGLVGHDKEPVEVEEEKNSVETAIKEEQADIEKIDEEIGATDTEGEQQIADITAVLEEKADIETIDEEAGATEVKGEQKIAEITGKLDEYIYKPEEMTIAERFMRDKWGNTLSVLVLLGMVFSVVWSGRRVLNSKVETRLWPNWIIPLLALIGLGVSFYLGFVELSNTEAVCGPVGDCNTVQQSPYAYLFGVIPIGVMGVIGYLVIGFGWLVLIYGPEDVRNTITWSLWGLIMLGTLFSIYLTFLEPFVIGASCIWCLTSATVMTLLLFPTTKHLTFTRIIR